MKIWQSFFIALAITLSCALYQRATGPTYPLRFTWKNYSGEYKLRFLRSCDNSLPCTIALPGEIQGKALALGYSRYPSSDPITYIPFTAQGNSWVADLPKQAPAGKLEYFVSLTEKDNSISRAPAEKPVILRFKGHVPDTILIPHISFMFLALLLGAWAGVSALTNGPHMRRLATLCLASFSIGGGVLGPIVQKFAFGDYWTGWPYGKDLTDNKVAISLLVWIFALIITWKKPRRWVIILAAIVMFIVYLIPHSLGGSELNYETMQVQTGLKKSQDK